MKTLYLDCVSGISGDMTVAALLDLGADQGRLLEGLKSMGLDGWEAVVQKRRRRGICGTDFAVRLETVPDAEERSLPEIEALIRRSGISEKVQALALQAFRHLAEAEGAIHGLPADQVHFHEVGATDSIVDLVGASLCLEDLGIERVAISPIPMARGTIRCRHGLIPLPAPATLELAKGMPICRPPAPTVRELATPTGLALAKSFASEFGEMPEGTVLRIGYGLGKMDLPWPNVLRAVLLETSAPPLVEQVVQLAANLDDMSGEALSHALERLLEEGALDAWLTPITMKKGRPAFILGVLCEPSEASRFAELVLRETSTLGVRQSSMTRRVLPRETLTVDTSYGPIACKVAHVEGQAPRVKPEHEDCRKAAAKAGLPLSTVFEAALLAARTRLSAGLS